METKVEVVKENQLVTILKESQLDETKANFILRNFQGYFSMAAEWEVKAKSIVVTRADQEAEMAMARAGRLFLKEKRLAIEGARKELKEQALREGKCIDGISNVLKALIIPIENYLDQQEHFVERQAEAKREAMRLEIEKRIEDERIAKEKADAEALEKARIENEKLKAEAVEREKQAQKERIEQEAIRAREWARTEAVRKNHEKKLAIERAKAKEALEEAEAEKKLIEEKARLEREKQEKTLMNERARAKRLAELAEEKSQAAQEAAIEKVVAERREKERLAELLKAQVTCPKCGHKFSKGK